MALQFARQLRPTPLMQQIRAASGSSDVTMRGTVKWFNERKGFGFIVPEQSEAAMGIKDVFVHFSSITMPGFKTLMEGDKVEFKLVESERGPQAETVMICRQD
eukprot:CAMPEP_0184655698 /NCGR_PEP_ID=MMETSP0308-20130426/14348_1 /TAXON_ID=38269 /ORGANISM="Gloeochaete witrockiana, Strain SAG 46.84" /LENGTH=102 /DNA_ID=CAMNT_0027092387 /DNA_START=98 /DNA_END=406 /DNA_ORIENTATION=-